jgi:hypothetical protein
MKDAKVVSIVLVPSNHIKTGFENALMKVKQVFNRLLSAAGYGVGEDSREQVRGDHIITVRVDGANTRAAIEKAIASAQSSGAQGINVYAPQIEGDVDLMLAEGFAAQYEGDKAIAIVADAYSDCALTSAEDKLPDLGFRIALGRQIFYCNNVLDEESRLRGMEDLRDLLAACGDPSEYIAISDIQALLRLLIRKPIRLEAIFQDIETWTLSNEAVAESA